MRRGIKCIVHLPAPLSRNSGGGGREFRGSSQDAAFRIQTLVGNRRLMDEQGIGVNPEAADWVRGAEGRGHTCAFVAGDGRCQSLQESYVKVSINSIPCISYPECQRLTIASLRRKTCQVQPGAGGEPLYMLSGSAGVCAMADPVKPEAAHAAKECSVRLALFHMWVTHLSGAVSGCWRRWRWRTPSSRKLRASLLRCRCGTSLQSSQFRCGASVITSASSNRQTHQAASCKRHRYTTGRVWYQS